jgi:uncharacterized DUF497 family protein
MFQVYNGYLTGGNMEFEFDPEKSIANKAKHNIDFVEAQNLWLDKEVFELRVPFVGEDRYLIIGKMLDKHWTAVVTYREEKIRIISVRRSRKQEVDQYEQQD